MAPLRSSTATVSSTSRFSAPVARIRRRGSRTCECFRAPLSCRRLSDAGLKLVCVTNQPDIARGTQDSATVAAINEYVRELLNLDEVVVCPHDDVDGCDCRKPLPGMIIEAARRLDLDVSRSVTVGDRWRDVEAGRAAGTWTVFVDNGYNERQPDGPDLIVKDLKEAVPWIIDKAQSPS